MPLSFSFVSAVTNYCQDNVHTVSLILRKLSNIKLIFSSSFVAKNSIVIIIPS